MIRRYRIGALPYLASDLFLCLLLLLPESSLSLEDLHLLLLDALAVLICLE